MQIFIYTQNILLNLSIIKIYYLSKLLIILKLKTLRVSTFSWCLTPLLAAHPALEDYKAQSFLWAAAARARAPELSLTHQIRQNSTWGSGSGANDSKMWRQFGVHSCGSADSTRSGIGALLVLLTGWPKSPFSVFCKIKDAFFTFTNIFIDLDILSMSAISCMVEHWLFSISVSISLLSTSIGLPYCGASSSKKSPAGNFANHFWHVRSVTAPSPYTAQVFVSVALLPFLI